ncbi:MAG: tetratricopeptide repeat protein [Planctomycetota bacterium]
MRFALSLPVILLLSGVSLARQDSLEEALRWTFSIEAEGRGEDDALAAELLARIVTEPESPVAELWALRAIETRATVRFPAEMAARAEEALRAAEPVNGFAAMWLRQWLASYFSEIGAWDRLEQVKDRSGRLEAWQTLGPLGFPALDLSDHRFAPEWEIDLKKTYDGVREPVRWREARVDPEEGTVDLFAGATPILGAAYGVTHVRSEESRGALLRFQCGTSCTVWLNGEVVYTIDRRGAEAADLQLFPVVLRSGWNRVLVKISSPRDRRFTLRIVDAQGRPLSGLEEWSPGEDPAVPELGEAAEGIEAPRPGNLGAALEADWARRDPYAALARMILATRGGDAIARLDEGEIAAEGAPDSPAAQTLFGENVNNNGRLPRDWRRNRARERFERALELEPNWVPALIQLASLLQEDDKSEEALQMIDRALAVNPECFAAWRARLGVFLQRGWEKEEVTVLETLDRIAPDHPRVAISWARYWDQKGNQNRRREALRRATEGSEEHEAWLSAEALRLRDLGDYQSALEVLDVLERHRSDESSTRRARAETLAAAGDTDAAIEVYRELVEEDPDSTPTLNTLADLMLRAGRDEEAIEVWQRSLEVAPDQHSLRGLVRELRGEPDAYADWELNVAVALATCPGREKYPEADSILVLDQAVTRVFADGSTETEIHQLRKLLTERGVESQSVQRLLGEVREVRTILPDGSTLEPIRVTGQEDQFTMPGLAPGASIETRFVMTTSGSFDTPASVAGFYFQDTDYREPFIFTRQVLVHPVDFDLPYQLYNEPKPQVIRQEKNGEVILSIFAQDMDLIQQEPNMPSPEDVVPFIEAGQSASWDLVHGIYREQTLRGTSPSPKIRELASELIGDATDLETKLRRLYHGVQEWVVAPRGPGDALSVLLTRRGSALSLFTAMLRSLDIPFDFVRARPKPPYSDLKDWDFINPELFPATLLRIPIEEGEDVWLASVESGVPFGRIPSALDAATGYVVGPQAGRLTQLPRIPRAERIGQKSSLDLTLQEDGSLRGKGRFMLPSFEGYPIKEQLRRIEATQQRRYALGILNQVWPGARVTDFELVGLDSPEEPLTISFELSLQGALRSGAIITGLQPLQLTAAFVTRSERVHPLVFGAPMIQVDHIRIDPGPYRFADVPDSLVTSLVSGHYGLAFEVTRDGILEIDRTVELEHGEVSPKKYPDFARLLREIDALERKRVPVVEK